MFLVEEREIASTSPIWLYYKYSSQQRILIVLYVAWKILYFVAVLTHILGKKYSLTSEYEMQITLLLQRWYCSTFTKMIIRYVLQLVLGFPANWSVHATLWYQSLRSLCSLPSHHNPSCLLYTSSRFQLPALATHPSLPTPSRGPPSSTPLGYRICASTAALCHYLRAECFCHIKQLRQPVNWTDASASLGACVFLGVHPLRPCTGTQWPNHSSPPRWGARSCPHLAAHLWDQTSAISSQATASLVIFLDAFVK